MRIRQALCGMLIAMTLSLGAWADVLKPLPGKDVAAPASVVKVVMTTDAGDLEIEVYPEAAPNAAARFLMLVQMGFYDNTPIFRVVKEPKPFVAQFGINSTFAPWENGKDFKDDPSLYQMERGTLAFAKAGADTNSTQVFINYTENNRLTAPNLNFSVFGKVVKGMEVADNFKSVGDPGMGLDQDALWKNTRLVDSLSAKPTMIVSAKVVSR